MVTNSDVITKVLCIFLVVSSLQVSNRNINDRVLKFTVFDVDRHKKHLVVGHALYPLKDHDCESNERLVIWRDLEREVLEVGMVFIDIKT